MDEERWIVVEGRRWRATDPSIPEPFRKELVAELMDARRAVGAARRAGDDGLATARSRVHDAKVALGERGEAWWNPPTDAGRASRMAATIRALARHRAPDRTICPSDAARAIGGEDWRSVMEVARSAARDLATAGEVTIEQGGAALEPDAPWRGPIRIRSADGPATP